MTIDKKEDFIDVGRGDYDILNMLNSISNFEVFTPFEVADSMVKLLPDEAFQDPNYKFLDPAVKSGIFLREIIYRLDAQLPRIIHTDKDTGKTYDLSIRKERTSHILRNMIYGIAISELTSYVTRRTIYGVMEANIDKSVEYIDSKLKAGKFDIEDSGTDLDFNKFYDHTIFNTEDRKGFEHEGNIFYPVDETTIATEDTHHPFINDTEHPFINKIKEGKMKFDVIIGNPPYQVSIEFNNKKNSRATAIYNKFIDLAISLKPKYISMIVPSRWMTKSAAGISNAWVEGMLNCNKFRCIYDYLDSNVCFNGVDIIGGVNYFLWDKDYYGECDYNIYNSDLMGFEKVFFDYLNSLSLDILIRNKKSISILKRINDVNNYFSNCDERFSKMVSSKDFFTNKTNLTTNWSDYSIDKTTDKDIKYYLNKRLLSRGFAWVSESDVPKNKDSIYLNKVFIPASGNGEIVLGTPFIGEPNSVCSQTYILIGYSKDKHNLSYEECINIITYIKTRFFRYLVNIIKRTQHAARGVYELVPMQDFNEPWDDSKLYKKYNLTEDEIKHIEETIKPME